jgi:hypothetical protein
MTVTCPKCGGDVVIHPRRAQRQSNLFHKLVAAYATVLGEDPEETKVMMKYWFGHWEPYPFDELPDWPGRFVELFEGSPDWCIVYMKSESAYTKQEETRLVDGTIARCIEAGVDLSWMEEL